MNEMNEWTSIFHKLLVRHNFPYPSISTKIQITFAFKASKNDLAISTLLLE